MPYQSSFIDNERYSAEDLNNIFRRVSSKNAGADVFSASGGPYHAKDLNALTARVVTAGVIADSKDTLGVTAGKGKALVNPGAAVFKDGTVAEVAPGGHELPFTAGVKQYVYFINEPVETNSETKRCRLVLTAEPPPENSDFVLLAEIGPDGAVTDRRTFAKRKQAGYAAAAGCALKVTVKAKCETKRANGRYSGTAVVNLSDAGQHRFLFSDFSFEREPDVFYKVHSFCDLEQNLYAGEYQYKIVNSAGHPLTQEHSVLNDRLRFCTRLYQSGIYYHIEFADVTVRSYAGGKLTLDIVSDAEDVNFTFLLY